jgi:hypothetical protein
MRTQLVVLASLLLLSGVAGAGALVGGPTAEAPPARPSQGRPDAAARFADAVSRARKAGAHLHQLEVVRDSDEIHLELVLGRGASNWRYRLRFDQDGRRALAYERTPVSASGERRIYRGANRLFALLARGPVRAVEAECRSYYIAGQHGGFTLDPYDYYVVEDRARGAAARSLLARSLAGALESGMLLTAVEASAREVDLVLLQEGEEIIHIEIDRGGTVEAVELRRAPAAYARPGQVYPDGATLARRLGHRAGVHRLRVVGRSGQAGSHLVMELVGGDEIPLDLGAFVADEDALELMHCPC